jgi:hypothetical protein
MKKNKPALKAHYFTEVMVPKSLFVHEHREHLYTKCPVCETGYILVKMEAFHYTAKCLGAEHFKTPAQIEDSLSDDKED